MAKAILIAILFDVAVFGILHGINVDISTSIALTVGFIGGIVGVVLADD